MATAGASHAARTGLSSAILICPEGRRLLVMVFACGHGSAVSRVVLTAVLLAALVAGASAQTVPVAAPAAPACVSVSLAVGGKRCIVPGSGRVEWFRDCEGCPEMVVLPRGSLASAPAQAGSAAPAGTGEGRVDFARPFAIGRFAVTFAQWDACVDAGGCNGYRPGDEGWGRGNRPVVNVSWEDTVAYARWLSDSTRKHYRIPSGVEREYAARASARTIYWWGDAIDLEQANIDLPVPARRQPGADYAALEKVRRRTVPVDSFAANPWGLYNVHGNVWEWTRDCAEPKVAPEGAGGATGIARTKRCGTRYSRGGSWLDFAAEAASASRIGFAADSRNRAQGFRLVRSLP